MDVNSIFELRYKFFRSNNNVLCVRFTERAENTNRW